MGAPKGRPRPEGAGRKKGTVNVQTRQLKDYVFAALNSGDGGEAWLTRQRDENPVAFMTLLGKFVPKDVNVGGQPDNPLTRISRIELIALGGKGTTIEHDDSAS